MFYNVKLCYLHCIMIYLSMKYFACSPTSAFGIQTGYEFHKCFVGCARGWHSFTDVPLTY